VRKDWEEHLSRKPSSCTPFLKGTLAGDVGEQSICRRCRLNSLSISGDNEELYLPGSSCRHAPHHEGTRSSSPYLDSASGNTDTSSAASRRLPRGCPRRLGKPRQLPDGDGALPTHPLPLIIRAKHSEDQSWEKLGRTASPTRYPLPLTNILLAPDIERTKNH
jgi:hypothetical protein